MNTFEMLLLIGGIAVSTAGIAVLLHAVSLRRKTA